MGGIYKLQFMNNGYLSDFKQITNENLKMLELCLKSAENTVEIINKKIENDEIDFNVGNEILSYFNEEYLNLFKKNFNLDGKVPDYLTEVQQDYCDLYLNYANNSRLILARIVRVK